MSEHVLDIDIVTPQKVIFSGQCIAVSLPGAKSPFQVLYNHAPIVSALQVGPIKIINTDNSETYYATEGGFAEVLNNRVSIVVETADESSEINIDAVEQEIGSLKLQLQGTSDIHQREALKNSIAIQENRFRVARKQS